MPILCGLGLDSTSTLTAPIIRFPGGTVIGHAARTLVRTRTLRHQSRRPLDSSRQVLRGSD